MPRPEISAILKLQSTQFVGELRKTRGQLSTFGNNIKAVGGIISSVFVTGAIGRSIKRTVDFADGLGKLSTQLGIGTRAIQEYRFAAERAGLSQAEVDKSLTAFTRRLGAFQRDGGGPAARAMEELGIALDDIADLNTEQVLSLVSDRMEQLGDRTRQVNIAQEFFSESGRRMVNVIGQGSRAFRAAVAPAEELGAIISEDLVKGSEEFNDSLSDLTDALGGLGREGLGPVLPLLTDFTNALTDLITADFSGMFTDTGLFTEFEAFGKVLTEASESLEEFFDIVQKVLPGTGLSDVAEGAGEIASALGFRRPVTKAAIDLPGEEVRALEIASPFAKAEAATAALTIADRKQSITLLEEGIKLSRLQTDVDKLQGDAKIKFLQDEAQLQLTILDLQKQIAIEEAEAKRDIDARRQVFFRGPSGGKLSGSFTERETINSRFEIQRQEILQPIREAQAELNQGPQTFSDGWRDAFSRFTQDSTIAFGLGQVVAQNFASGVQGLFRQQIQGLFNDLEQGTLSWKDSLESTIDIIKGIVVQILAAVAAQATLVALSGGAAAAPGVGAVTTSASGGGAGGFGGRFAGLFSGDFASGGSFTVGGRGGLDRNLVALGVSQGERVTVETPAQQMRGGINVTVNNNSSRVQANATTSIGPGGQRTIDVVVEDIIDQSIRRGRVGQTIAGTFGLGRTGRVG